MIHQTENEHCLINHHSHVCWSAVFAGAFVGVGLGFLLHLFGTAIGLSAYSADASGAQVIAIGGILGFLIGVIVSMGAAGYVAGYLGRFKQCYCHGGIIYGFVTWSLALALSAVLVMPIAKYTMLYKYSLAHSVATQATTSQSTAPDRGEPHPANPTAANQATATDLAWGAWLMFGLFFIGALSCCFGACCGMKCRKDVVLVNNTTTLPPH